MPNQRVCPFSGCWVGEECRSQALWNLLPLLLPSIPKCWSQHCCDLSFLQAAHVSETHAWVKGEDLLGASQLPQRHSYYWHPLAQRGPSGHKGEGKKMP